MKPAKKNLTVVQTATFARRLRFPSLDLTGASAHMQIREAPGGALYADLTVANGGITITPGLPSIIDLLIPASVTASIPGNGIYDLVLRMPGGVVYRVLEGGIHLSRGVTVP